MKMANALRMWLFGSSSAEAGRLRRIDVIRGHRLEMAVPAIPVFAARPKVARRA